jgi:hypothetical protein
MRWKNKRQKYYHKDHKLKIFSAKAPKKALYFAAFFEQLFFILLFCVPFHLGKENGTKHQKNVYSLSF